MTNKYNFYTVVKVVSNKFSLRKIYHCEGVIVGMSQNEITGRWGYAVSIYNDNGLVWSIMEEDLQTTGKSVDPKDRQSVETIKVEVDNKTGEAIITSKRSPDETK